MKFIQSKKFQDGGLEFVLLVRHGEQFKETCELVGCVGPSCLKLLESWAAGTWIIYQ